MEVMKYSIKQFNKDFPNDDACLDYIFKMRFPNVEGYYRVKNRKCYSHKTTKHQIHPLAGTIFEKSSTPLTLWFTAIYLVATSKHGVSSNELKDKLGVTYKCAWRMNYKIRQLMKQGTDLFEGIVEADETYIGGRKRGGHGMKEKTPVIGLLERGGIVRAKKVDEVNTGVLIENIRDNVKFGSRLVSDEASIYKKTKQLGLLHDYVTHSKGEYVRGDVYTNSLEGFWSQLKRSINGTYHSVSIKHLQSYVDEFAFRYSFRASEVPVFHLMMASALLLPDGGGQKKFSSLAPVA